jgi:phage tail sheath gpL-like
MVDTVIPTQGTPGIFDPRNPTLLPNFDKPNYSSDSGNNSDPNGTGAGALGLSSPAGYLKANPRVEATATATIGGSVTTGDILSIQATNPAFPGGFIEHSYTTVGGDTVTTIAEQFADLFNDDANAAAVGLRADAAGAVITFRQGGPVGNFSVLSAPTEEGATITIAGTALTGDQITALFTSPNLPGGYVAVTQAVTTGQSATTIAGNLVSAINANAALIAAGITATNLAGVITLVVPVADEPVVVSTWVNSNPLTATIGGSVAVGGGDVLNLVFTGAGIPGSPVTVSYTTIAGDTTSTIATALAALINANPSLQDVGIEASPAAAVITISFTLGNVGQVRLTQSVSPGSETITVTTAPTTTSTLGTAATETITFSPTSGKMSGGTGPIIATNNFEFAMGNSQVQAFFYGQPYNLGYDVITAMVQQGMPVI